MWPNDLLQSWWFPTSTQFYLLGSRVRNSGRVGGQPLAPRGVAEAAWCPWQLGWREGSIGFPRSPGGWARAAVSWAQPAALPLHGVLRPLCDVTSQGDETCQPAAQGSACPQAQTELGPGRAPLLLCLSKQSQAHRFKAGALTWPPVGGCQRVGSHH